MTISTSVSSMLLFKVLALAMAVPKPKLIFVEEPEYALAPIQQVILARFIEEVLNRARELGHNTYIILVTHSPYIALGMRRAENTKVYYFMYSKRKGKFKAEEAWPAREFALASLLMLSLGAES
ncbi:MAG: ATP-binding protein [Desulfurococcaceae archaeon]|nr:ATP-binding protein [Desulfurococcaceae archaeon]MCC6055574.1 ATP-binding protein [Desulfurococcaceae archaeon]